MRRYRRGQGPKSEWDIISGMLLFFLSLLGALFGGLNKSSRSYTRRRGNGRFQ